MNEYPDITRGPREPGRQFPCPSENNGSTATHVTRRDPHLRPRSRAFTEHGLSLTHSQLPQEHFAPFLPLPVPHREKTAPPTFTAAPFPGSPDDVVLLSTSSPSSWPIFICLFMCLPIYLFHLVLLGLSGGFRAFSFSSRRFCFVKQSRSLLPKQNSPASTRRGKGKTENTGSACPSSHLCTNAHVVVKMYHVCRLENVLLS